MEDLIRKILVKNPAQRFTINQIKAHPWVTAGNRNSAAFSPRPSSPVLTVNGELNPQVLQLMQGLSIDIQKTKTVSFTFCVYQLFLDENGPICFDDIQKAMKEALILHSPYICIHPLFFSR